MAEDLSKELVAASSEPLVMAILNQGENYGYAIIQKIRVCSADRIQWTDGMLYPVLHRLEKRGWITSRWAAGRGGPKRKYYSLTAKGRKQLQHQVEHWNIVNETLNALWNLNSNLKPRFAAGGKL